MRISEWMWDKVNAIPGSFTRTSAEAFYEAALNVPGKGQIVEIGVDQGRSASILLQASLLTNARILLVDSWESVLIDNMEKVKQLCAGFPQLRIDIWNLTSELAAKSFNDPIDLIHIDANHYDPFITQDCELWLPKVKSGGVACFHDYKSCFEDVTPAVDKYTAGWEDLGNHEGLAIRRKP